MPSPRHVLAADADDAALVRAVEGCTSELLLRMGDAGGGHRRDGGEVSWTLGGSGSWHVGPSMRPDDLVARLERAGFVADGEEPGMTARLDESSLEPAADLRIEVEAVRDQGTLDQWIRALGSGFGEGQREADWVGEMFRRIGLDHPDWRHLLVRRDGQLVGTATVLLAAGVGGLFFIMTVPEACKQGIGTQITRVAMRVAQEAGMHQAVLTSSPMGRSVYESVGFRQVCTIRLHTWQPE